MHSDSLDLWLKALGYGEVPGSLHRRSGHSHWESHRYGLEISELLRPDGNIRAHAVFDVEGTPTVCFVAAKDSRALDEASLDRIRQRIWNQNLISVVMVLGDSEGVALPVQPESQAQVLSLSAATASSDFSAAEFQSGDIQARLPDWFRPESRVDRQLIENIGRAVSKLEEHGVSTPNAQYLIGQVLFISYLEHREIISETYRDARRVSGLHDLIVRRDVSGLVRLLRQLRSDFNGDFLRPEGTLYEVWEGLTNRSYRVIGDFLSRVNLETGQLALWNYDFSFIPVELLSGIYESFLSAQQAELGAYYTPRHLANLVVDQAFAGSANILDEVVYDGACGSGILLTTAFRRMLAVAEARTGEQLSLRDRIALLESHIYGTDISETACRVTAFSLYLALLERLRPSDIVALQENEHVKLPRLLESNLFGGERKGDFFSAANPVATSRRFSLFLSNPPWREPKGDEVLTSDRWAEKEGMPRARRQLAADFANRVIGCLREGGRLCMILPVSLLLAATSQAFVKGWLLRVRIERIINLGDLQQLLFENGSHSCLVVVARPRGPDTEHTIPNSETLEYWAPKSDVSLAFGRLTLQSGDRHRVQTQSIWEDPGRLVTLMWGDSFDLSLWQRLKLSGTFGAFLKRKGWVNRKGFHRLDSSRTPVSSEPLRRMRFVPVEALTRGLPVLDLADLEALPANIRRVAALPDDLMKVFRGPRILFPDGFSAEDRKVRAVFTSRDASFTSSVGVVSGPKSDEDLLRFVTVYLRSELTSYFLLMRAFQVLTERNRVSLLDIAGFPFIDPDYHAHRDLAKAIVQGVADITRRMEKDASPLRIQGRDDRQAKCDELIYDYFGIDSNERALVHEAVTELLPAVRPRGYKKLRTRPQEHADLELVERYAACLRDELETWRAQLGGAGNIEVRATVTSFKRAGPWGVVRVALKDKEEKSIARKVVEQSERAVEAIIEQLRRQNLLPIEMSGEWYFAADAIIWGDRELYLIRPLKRRFWLQRTALRDARRIVETVQSPTRFRLKAA